MSDPILSPHYVRFARSLALSASLALPACGASVDDPSLASSPQPVTSATTPSAAEPHANAPVYEGVSAHAPEPVRAASPEDAAAVVADAGEVDAAPPDPYSNPYAQDASADAPRAFHSGPLPPPELPLGMG